MMDFWKVLREDLLVLVDDMALDLGRIRLRAGGSDGGHNGLASIIQHLGHDQFARLRVGIGPAPKVEDHATFVLARFTAQEQTVVDEAIDRAVEAAECWMTEGLTKAMNRFNAVKED
jgi:PTH1 family peptidyl-tRNA hydrolase